MGGMELGREMGGVKQDDPYMVRLICWGGDMKTNRGQVPFSDLARAPARKRKNSLDGNDLVVSVNSRHAGYKN